MSKVPYIKSKKELKDYILRRLGYPVINVELTKEQLDDIINETLEKFVEVAYPGIQLRLGWLKVQENQQKYKLPYEVMAVVKVYGPGELTSMMSGPFGFNAVLAKQLESVYFSKADLVSIELIREYVSTLDVMFSKHVEYDFNTMTKELYFLTPVKSDQIYGILFYESVDEQENPHVYDHRWIKKYATELARLQWGRNLLKYAGSMLPSGLQINVEGIISEAKEELAKLEEELEDKYQLPIDFFIG